MYTRHVAFLRAHGFFKEIIVLDWIGSLRSHLRSTGGDIATKQKVLFEYLKRWNCRALLGEVIDRVAIDSLSASVRTSI